MKMIFFHEFNRLAKNLFLVINFEPIRTKVLDQYIPMNQKESLKQQQQINNQDKIELIKQAMKIQNPRSEIRETMW